MISLKKFPDACSLCRSLFFFEMQSAHQISAPQFSNTLTYKSLWVTRQFQFPSVQSTLSQLKSFLQLLRTTSASETGTAAVSTPTYYFQQLSKALSDSLAELTATTNTLQNQTDFLVEIILQNRWATDLLVAEKGYTITFSRRNAASTSTSQEQSELLQKNSKFGHGTYTSIRKQKKTD